MSTLETLEDAREVPLDRIGEALADLWGTAKADPTAPPLLRACGLTLFVLTEAGEEEERLERILARASVRSPARTVFLVREAKGDPSLLSARVRAQCLLTRGGRHVCQEVVRIAFAEARTGDVASVAVPLAEPDLPAVLLGPDVGRALDPRLTELRRGVDVVAFDLARGAATDQLLPALAERVERRPYGLRDLAFDRDLPWRQAVAGAYDVVSARGGRFVEVVGEAPEDLAEAWVLLAWIDRRSPWPIEARVEPPRGEGGRRLAGLRLRAEAGGAAVEFVFRRHGPHVVDETAAEHAEGVCVLPRPLPHERRLLGDLLADPSASAEFEGSLARALELLGRREA